MANRIDYGNGKTNINKETGIRFGVINPNHIDDAQWYEHCESVYPDPNIDEVECPNCRASSFIGVDQADENVGDDSTELKWGDEVTCTDCGNLFTLDKGDCAVADEPIEYRLITDEYQMSQTPCRDIFVHKSPYYTLCEYCSPCAPGAGYLMNSGYVKAYCLGHDWFRQGIAPYPVYSVETGQIVNPDTPYRMQYKMLRSVTLEDFRLVMFDTGRTDDEAIPGRRTVAYEFYDNGQMIFFGEDYNCYLPKNASIDLYNSATCGLLTFLSLKPGDTDADYFNGYTKCQREWMELRAEDLQILVYEMENKSDE